MRPIGRAVLRILKSDTNTLVDIPVDIIEESLSIPYNRVIGEEIGERVVHKSALSSVEIFESEPLGEKEEKPSLNLRAMLTGDLNRLRYIQRYSTSLVIHKESVAEHVAMTALYSLFISEWLASIGYRDKIVLETVFQKALLHDVEECLTGDIPRPLKYASFDFQKALHEIASARVDTLLKEIVPGDLSVHWQEAKNDTIEGCIVEFSDFLSVLSYLYVEVTNMNVSIAGFYDSMHSYAAIFDAEKFEPLRPLIKEARSVLDKLYLHTQTGEVR